VLARTPDPHDQPAINPRYLAEDTDRRAMVGGLKFLRRLFAAPAMARYVVAEKLPGPSVQSDDELLDYARANGSTVYHASCSCMMAQHAMAVVDDQLRVHGVGKPPRDRRLGDAGGHLNQHERADNHDCREGRRDHQRRSAAKIGGVAIYDLQPCRTCCRCAASPCRASEPQSIVPRAH
jgi:hypothetical protein